MTERSTARPIQRTSGARSGSSSTRRSTTAHGTPVQGAPARQSASQRSAPRRRPASAPTYCTFPEEAAIDPRRLRRIRTVTGERYTLQVFYYEPWQEYVGFLIDAFGDVGVFARRTPWPDPKVAEGRLLRELVDEYSRLRAEPPGAGGSPRGIAAPNIYFEATDAG